jgi:predicted GTPase
MSYYPGRTNVHLADVIVINKIDSANLESINAVRENVLKINPAAKIVEAASPISLENERAGSLIRGKKVLVVEDGPTLTHGEMKYGAGTIAAQKFEAAEIVDPRPYATKSIKQTYQKYPGIGILLPAMGYGDAQMKDLEATISKIPCDAVIIGTPIDLRRIINIKQPAVRVSYDLQEIGKPDLRGILTDFIKQLD